MNTTMHHCAEPLRYSAYADPGGNNPGRWLGPDLLNVFYLIAKDAIENKGGITLEVEPGDCTKYFLTIVTLPRSADHQYLVYLSPHHYDEERRTTWGAVLIPHDYRSAPEVSAEDWEEIPGYAGIGNVCTKAVVRDLLGWLLRGEHLGGHYDRWANLPEGEENDG